MSDNGKAPRPAVVLDDAVCDFCGKEALCFVVQSEFPDSPDGPAVCEACSLAAVSSFEEYETDCATDD